jgi:hypothetical protein
MSREGPASVGGSSGRLTVLDTSAYSLRRDAAGQSARIARRAGENTRFGGQCGTT